MKYEERKSFKDLNENSVEEWAKLLDKEPKSTSLEKEKMQSIITLALYEETIEENETTEKFFESTPVASAFRKRIEMFHNYEITKTGMIFLFLAFPKFNFGTSTMMANYLQYISKINNIKKFSIDYLMTSVFPLGVFSEETLQKAWEMQKIKSDNPNSQIESDNMLDYAFCCKSLKD